LVAQGLKKAGIRYSIFEATATDRYKGRDWGVMVHWALPLLEDCLPKELVDELPRVQVDQFYEAKDFDYMPMLNSSNGELLAKIPYPRSRRFSRQRLREICGRGIDIQYEKRCSGISFGEENGVTVSFEDGTTVSGTAVAGCDGAKSFVREVLFGKEVAAAKLSGIIIRTGLSTFSPDVAKSLREIHPILVLGPNPNGRLYHVAIIEVPKEQDPSTWKFQVGFTEKAHSSDVGATDADRLVSYKHGAEQLVDPFGLAIRNIPDDAKFLIANILYWETIPWDNHGGRVMLVGDSAHPIPLQRGQGCNQSIVDCGRYVSAITKAFAAHDVPESAEGESMASLMAMLMEDIVKRGADEVVLSYQNGLMVHSWDTLMASPLMKKGAAAQNMPELENSK
jgi:2-polyprenyl-6-methoxyphenol hydroxylase-like FAD-dependent oxidoreductase